MDLHAYSFAYYGKSIFLSSIFCLFLKFRFVNSVRNRNETYVSRENLVFPFKNIYYYSLNRNFDSSSLKDIYIYVYVLRLAKVEGGVKRDFRDGENIFRRWVTPICRRGRQTLEQTHIRICICKGMARRLPREGSQFEFLFSSAGEYWHRVRIFSSL